MGEYSGMIYTNVLIIFICVALLGLGFGCHTYALVKVIRRTATKRTAVISMTGTLFSVASLFLSLSTWM